MLIALFIIICVLPWALGLAAWLDEIYFTPRRWRRAQAEWEARCSK
jgi:hypothetical protein